MKKICSVTGFVPAKETIAQTLHELGIAKEQLKENMENGLFFSKEECVNDCGMNKGEKAKKVKVTVWVSVEVIPEKAKKK